MSLSVLVRPKQFQWRRIGPRIEHSLRRLFSATSGYRLFPVLEFVVAFKPCCADRNVKNCFCFGSRDCRWKVKFICSLCHKNGLVEEATKDLKYCTARAQHSWTNNRKVMLVQTSKKTWVQVRDLPYLKNKVAVFSCMNFVY